MGTWGVTLALAPALALLLAVTLAPPPLIRLRPFLRQFCQSFITSSTDGDQYGKSSGFTASEWIAVCPPPLKKTSLGCSDGGRDDGALGRWGIARALVLALALVIALTLGRWEVGTLRRWGVGALGRSPSPSPSSSPTPSPSPSSSPCHRPTTLGRWYVGTLRRWGVGALGR